MNQQAVGLLINVLDRGEELLLECGIIERSINHHEGEGLQIGHGSDLGKIPVAQLQFA